MLERISETGKGCKPFDPQDKSFTSAEACLSSCSQQCEPSAPSNREKMLSKSRHKARTMKQLSEPHHSRLSVCPIAQKAVVRGTSAPSGVTSASSFKRAEDLSPQVYFAYTILCLAVSSRLAWGRQFSGAQGQERSLRISLSQEH